MNVYIRNMVCLRCILLVKDELERLNLEYEEVKLGCAIVKEPVTVTQLENLKNVLLKAGLEIIDDKKSRLIEKIKTSVIEQVHYSDEPLRENFSSFISNRLHYDYTYLSNLFASTQGMTLEHYILYNKIEKVKELLIYEELTIAEIAHKMNYSSAAHLSKQFKQITGFTASYYKNLQKIRKEEKR